MKFKTQVCTTKEQSERLLALGLKKETADMTLFLAVGRVAMTLVGQTAVDCGEIRIGGVGIPKEQTSYLPAWSLDRLMNLCPKIITHNHTGRKLSFSMTVSDVFYKDNSTCSVEETESFDMNRGVYDNIIDCIEWLIEEGYFNKQYLEDHP